MFSKSSVPVLIANLIAWPVAWYYLHYWLQGFAYRIPLNPLYFLGAGLAAASVTAVFVDSNSTVWAGTASGYFDDLGAMADIVDTYDGNCRGVYLTLNPVNPAMLALAATALKKEA